MADMTEPAKLLLLASILSKGGVITQNGAGFLKELILKRDPRLLKLLVAFDSEDSKDANFLDSINRIIGEAKRQSLVLSLAPREHRPLTTLPRFSEEEAECLYNALFSECSLERGKSVSKAERSEKGLTGQKVGGLNPAKLTFG